MKYNECITANILYDKLKEIYQDKRIDKDRFLSEQGTVELYSFNIWDDYENDLVPRTVITYDDNFKRAFIATSSDGVLEKQVLDFFRKKGIKCGIEINVKKNALEVARIPFVEIKEL